MYRVSDLLQFAMDHNKYKANVQRQERRDFALSHRGLKITKHLQRETTGHIAKLAAKLLS
jgi:hypothetical protein